ncbi:MAG TPA: hypothetical protein VGO62_18120 [Myxococcota bacterium]
MIAVALASLLAAQAPPLPPIEPIDALAPCRALVRANRLDEAGACLLAHKDDPRAQPMLDAIAAWQAQPAVVGPVPEPAVLDVKRLVDSGAAEALGHGLALGAGAGFVSTATYFATTRTDQRDSLPWLLASPVVGAVAGAALSTGALALMHPTPVQISFAASTAWAGASQGFVLQLGVFDDSAAAAPLRLITILAGGALGLASGVALAPFLDASTGDIAVANSMYLWGGALALEVVLAFDPLALTHRSASSAFLVAGGAFVPYAIALACAPLLHIERAPSWLIDAGGAAGFLVAAAFVVAAQQQSPGAFWAAGTAAGVVAGTAAAVVVSDAGPDLHASATALVDVKGHAVAGLTIGGAL